MFLKVENLTKNYGGQCAVDNLSFGIEKGEIVGFLGPNGAGKSTTMKMITGFLQPSSGSIKVQGQAIGQSNQYKAKIGYLPEHNPLYGHMYVPEFLTYMAQLNAMPAASIKYRVNEVIHQVGLRPEQHKTIGELSKGYRQRVGLAQALIHQPEILILDEPTTGLDPNQLAEIRALIKTEGQSKAVLFSTHIMQEVEAICDRIILINKGKIVAQGTLEAIKQQGHSLEEIFKNVTRS